MSKILEVQGLCVRFDPEPGQVLHDVTLALDQGERVAIVGPSGCGKTTFLRALTGLITDGFDHCIHWETSIVRPVPIVWQDIRLFPWLTVRDNIDYSQRLHGLSDGRSVNQLLEAVEMRWAANLWPVQLSRGQAQRVAFARCLATGSRVLLLDEPFASLDAISRKHMGTLLLKLAETHSLAYLLVTHDVSEALELAKRVLVFSGRPTTIIGEHTAHDTYPSGTAQAIWNSLLSTDLGEKCGAH